MSSIGHFWIITMMYGMLARITELKRQLMDSLRWSIWVTVLNWHLKMGHGGNAESSNWPQPSTEHDNFNIKSSEDPPLLLGLPIYAKHYCWFMYLTFKPKPGPLTSNETLGETDASKQTSGALLWTRKSSHREPAFCPSDPETHSSCWSLSMLDVTSI